MPDRRLSQHPLFRAAPYMAAALLIVLFGVVVTAEIHFISKFW